MGRHTSPTQHPSEVDFFKIHETTFDPKTGMWGNDVLRKQNMTWKVQIPSDLKAGDYIVRHELIALHYGDTNGAESYISCLNLKLLGDGIAEPKETVRFPGAYDPSHPGLKINIYHMENKYVSLHIQNPIWLCLRSLTYHY
jgi:cellulase